MSTNTTPIDASAKQPAAAQAQPAKRYWAALMAQIAALHADNPEQRTLVLLPFVQLLPTAKAHWLALQPSGLMPRFETSSSWAASLAPMAQEVHEYRGNIAHDSLQARSLLAQVPNLQTQSEALYAPLLAICAELAPLAASIPAPERAAWGQRWQAELPALLPGTDYLDTERQLQALAAAWLGLSTFASDALFSPAAGAQFEQIILVQGLHRDVLNEGLANFWQAQGKAVQRLPLAPTLDFSSSANPETQVFVCDNEEALLAHSAYQVLQTLHAGHRPVALIAQDRHATRQLRAMLEAQGAQIKDDTGWKLSTTHAASRIMALLTAALEPHNNAAQIAWLKIALPANHAALALLEKGLAQAHTPLAQNAMARASLQQSAGRSSTDALAAVFTLLDNLTQLHSLLPSSARLDISRWQAQLKLALALHGQDALLAADEAGVQILRLLTQACNHSRPFSLAAFAAWLRDVLENAHFLSPTAPQQPDVVILPLSQMLGRSFAATVWPGVDANNLPLLPAQKSSLSRKQRAALGLPSPEEEASAQQQAFLLAMAQPQLTLLWHAHKGEQAISPSPLLQAWQQAQACANAVLPQLPLLQLPTQTLAPPQPQAGALRLRAISASSYEALRACPYQFFATRLLALQSDGELEQDPDQRDWGNFVHASLQAFHEARAETRAGSQDDAALLQRCAETQMQRLARDLGENTAALLLPYRHSWPNLAAQYLAWLAEDEAENSWQFQAGEYAPQPSGQLVLDAPEAPLTLSGRIDRLDHNQAGKLRVLDYKTGSASALEKKLKRAGEDTQLPFYALLLGEAAAQLHSASYLVLRANEAVKLIASPQPLDAAEALAEGIRADMNRIYAGSPMPALGSDQGACKYCAARGLCRKGQWQNQREA